MFEALDRSEGNRTRAAKILGMSFRAYRYWIQELGGVDSLPREFPWPEDFPPAAVQESEPGE
jgi:two-component system response regulator PilR (NtrC family)